MVRNKGSAYWLPMCLGEVSGRLLIIGEQYDDRAHFTFPEVSNAASRVQLPYTCLIMEYASGRPQNVLCEFVCISLLVALELRICTHTGRACQAIEPDTCCRAVEAG